MTSPRWTKRPEGSNWGEFGADDQLGRLNLLTPEKVRQGAAEIREGLSFGLSLPLDIPGRSVLNPSRLAPRLKPTTQGGGQPSMNFSLNLRDPRNTDVVCDDQVLISLQYSTQWDSFAHIGAWFDADGDGEPEKVYYNGYRAHEDILGPGDLQLAACPCGADGSSYALKLGIEHFAVKAIQGRGVLIDLHAHLGDQREAVGYERLMRILEADRVEIETGDMVLLHTGFSTQLLAMGREPDAQRLAATGATLDGRDERLLQWITDSGLAALCADNYAVEQLPAREIAGDTPRPALPLHEHCLFKLGVPLGELWWLQDLAHWLRANRRSRFMLTAPPLRLPGAVGSPVTAVATV